MAISFAEKIRARNLCLTHFGQARLSNVDAASFKQGAEAFRKEPLIPIYVAEDGLMFHFDNNGDITTSQSVNKTTEIA